MTKVLKITLLSLSFIGLTACVSTSDIKVETTKSNKVDLKGYTKYQFLEGSGLAKDTSKDILTKDGTASNVIESEINSVLMKKGKVPVSKNPDFFVAYLGGANRDHVTKKLDKDGKNSIAKYDEAAIVLMLIDADSGAIIWMSTAEGQAKGGTNAERKKRLDYAVKKMLKGI
jgi:hypothetical protein